MLCPCFSLQWLLKPHLEYNSISLLCPTDWSDSVFLDSMPITQTFVHVTLQINHLSIPLAFQTLTLRVLYAWKMQSNQGGPSLYRNFRVSYRNNHLIWEPGYDLASEELWFHTHPKQKDGKRVKGAWNKVTWAVRHLLSISVGLWALTLASSPSWSSLPW